MHKKIKQSVLVSRIVYSVILKQYDPNFINRLSNEVK